MSSNVFLTVSLRKQACSQPRVQVVRCSCLQCADRSHAKLPFGRRGLLDVDVVVVFVCLCEDIQPRCDRHAGRLTSRLFDS